MGGVLQGAVDNQRLELRYRIPNGAEDRSVIEGGLEREFALHSCHPQVAEELAYLLAAI